MAVFFQSFARHFSLYNLMAALGLCAALVFALRRLMADGFNGRALHRITAAAAVAVKAAEVRAVRICPKKICVLWLWTRQKK